MRDVRAFFRFFFLCVYIQCRQSTHSRGKVAWPLCIYPPEPSKLFGYFPSESHRLESVFFFSIFLVSAFICSDDLRQDRPEHSTIQPKCRLFLHREDACPTSISIIGKRNVALCTSIGLLSPTFKSNQFLLYITSSRAYIDPEKSQNSIGYVYVRV